MLVTVCAMTCCKILLALPLFNVYTVTSWCFAHWVVTHILLRSCCHPPSRQEFRGGNIIGHCIMYLMACVFNMKIISFERKNKSLNTPFLWSFFELACRSNSIRLPHLTSDNLAFFDDPTVKFLQKKLKRSTRYLTSIKVLLKNRLLPSNHRLDVEL